MEHFLCLLRAHPGLAPWDGSWELARDHHTHSAKKEPQTLRFRHSTACRWIWLSRLVMVPCSPQGKALASQAHSVTTLQFLFSGIIQTQVPLAILHFGCDYSQGQALPS